MLDDYLAEILSRRCTGNIIDFLLHARPCLGESKGFNKEKDFIPSRP